jgi:isoamylase
MEAQEFSIEKGTPHPPGATPDLAGVNFSIYSQHATGVELLVFGRHDAPEPSAVLRFDPDVNKTFHFWHAYVRGLRPGCFYAYRIDGPADAAAGHRFDHEKVLIDPYAKGLSKDLWRRGDACVPGDNLETSLRGAVIDTADYDWEGDRPLRRPMAETVIYEMHVRGFTRHPSSGVAHPGTFLGVIEKIPYLQALGVTAVELLPVFDFDDNEDPREVDGRRLANYWGYSTMGYFAPHDGYCVSPECGAHVREFRDMVKALHRAGIEVILDVVFNHTDEGNQLGPTFSFKGLDNSTYYYLSPQDRRYYMDYTGCGNTFNCNHPIGEKLVTDCLRYWVREMHVDGFRFDEASVLSRGLDGAPLEYPPILWSVELDEELADAKLIAEAWDAGGLYQVGHFPGLRWAEWNGRFRDDVRRFVKGDPGLLGAVASRIVGSADLYQSGGRLPINSVNFVTAHDGFTLNDLVSYDRKHNEANGEENRDGVDDNQSWNCGVEGPADPADPDTEALRERQVRNFATLLLLSRGVPMILMGDEVRRTQGGNNNAYCQDNETSWLDWGLEERRQGLLRFWRLLIAFRQRHPVVRQPRYCNGGVNERGLADITWHGCRLGDVDWHDGEARALAFTLGGCGGEADLHVMMNMYWEPLDFEVPPVPGRRWRLAIDTARPSPEDIAAPGEEPPFNSTSCRVAGRSIVVLTSRSASVSKKRR